MGIVRINSALEDYFTNAGIEWSSLKDREYRELVKEWRLNFESKLNEDKTYSGNEGVYLFEQNLPINGFIFNCPNYSYLPTTENREFGGYTFAYKISGLTSLERTFFNEQEVIVCDKDFGFMCAFNHEAPDWIPEIYCES